MRPKLAQLAVFGSPMTYAALLPRYATGRCYRSPARAGAALVSLILLGALMGAAFCCRFGCSGTDRADSLAEQQPNRQQNNDLEQKPRDKTWDGLA